MAARLTSLHWGTQMPCSLGDSQCASLTLSLQTLAYLSVLALSRSPPTPISQTSLRTFTVSSIVLKTITTLMNKTQSLFSKRSGQQTVESIIEWEKGWEVQQSKCVEVSIIAQMRLKRSEWGGKGYVWAVVSLLLSIRTVTLSCELHVHSKEILGKPPLSRCIPLRNQIVLDDSVVEKHQRATQPT